MLVRFLLPLLAAVSTVTDALLNVSIDDTDFSMITYQGTWEASSTHLSGLDYGGSHTLSSDPQANATFVFTGVDVYYLSPRWPYNVYSRLSIDGEPSALVNLTDPNASPTPPGGSESAPYSVAWSALNLANTTHTVLVTYGDYIVVDGFIYTVDNGSSPIVSSSPAPSSTSASVAPSGTSADSSAEESTIPSGHNGLTIGLATALPLAALVAAALIAFAYCQRRSNLRRRPTRTKFVVDDSPPVQPVYAAVSPIHRQMSSIASSRYPSSSTPEDGVQYQAFSASSQKQMPSSTLSIASFPRGPTDLPPGAGAPVIPVNPYTERPMPMPVPVPSEENDLSAHSMTVSPASSSRVLYPKGGPPVEAGLKPPMGLGATDLRRGVSEPPVYAP